MHVLMRLLGSLQYFSGMSCRIGAVRLGGNHGSDMTSVFSTDFSTIWVSNVEPHLPVLEMYTTFAIFFLAVITFVIFTAIGNQINGL